MGRLIGYARVSTHPPMPSGAVEGGRVRQDLHEKVSSRTPEEKRIQLKQPGNPGGRGLPLHKQVGPLWKKMHEVVCRLHDLRPRNPCENTDGLLTQGPWADGTPGDRTTDGLAEARGNCREDPEHRAPQKDGRQPGGRPGLPQIKKDHIIGLREEGNSLGKIVSLTGVSLAAVQKTCKEHQAGSVIV